MDIEERGLYKQLVETATEVDALQSEDSQYSSFIGDFTQHCINNNDWDEEYLFVERLGILKNDDNFYAFVEAVLNPSLHEDETTINNVAAIVTNVLKEANFGLSLFEYDERGLPYYLIVQLSPDAKPRDVQIECKYRFVVKNNHDGRACNFSSHNVPKEKVPCFVLVFNSGWNDFSVQTWYELFWYDNYVFRLHIGTVKVLAKVEKTREEIENAEQLLFNWQLGRNLVTRKVKEQWDVGVVEQLSMNLQAAFPESKGFSATNLWRMKQWYQFYSDALIKLSQLVGELQFTESQLNIKLAQVVGELQITTNQPSPILAQPVRELEFPHVFGFVPCDHHIEIIEHCQLLTSERCHPKYVFQVENCVGLHRR